MARLAHGWRLSAGGNITPVLIREFIRPAVRAIPSAMARQVGVSHLSLVTNLDFPDMASQWTQTGSELEISIATEERDHHDIALELLVCVGQALWEKLTPEQSRAYWRILDAEIQTGVGGEIDEDAFREKKALLGSTISATSRRRLGRYGRASFAGTAAEYVHSLWHDVHIVSGPEHLPSRPLRRRFELLERWFPPNRGYRL